MSSRSYCIFPDVGRKREILDMIVKCKNTLCTWRGEIREWENHSAECPWQLVECTSKCGEKIAKKMMDEHLLKECSAPLKCKYAVIGCTFQGRKDILVEHLSKDFDDHLALQISNQNKQINLLKTKLEEKESVISHTEITLAKKGQQIDEVNKKFDEIEGKMNKNIEKKNKEIKDMQDQLVNKNQQIDEVNKKFDEIDGKMSKIIEKKSEEIKDMQDQLANRDHQIDEVNKKFDDIIGEMNKIIEKKSEEIKDVRDQLANKNQQIDELNKKCNEIEKKMNKNIEKKNEEIKNAQDRLVKKKDHLVIQIDKLKKELQEKHANHETAIDSLKKSSLLHCPFYWVMEDFTAEFEDSKKTNKILYSKPFYCFNGYKGRLRLDLNGNGDGKDNSISVFFQIMKGPFDDSLEWPMSYQKITFKLMINENLMEEHVIASNTSIEIKNKFIRPIRDAEKAFGKHKFFPHNKLPKLSKNDMVSFYVNLT